MGCLPKTDAPAQALHGSERMCAHRTPAPSRPPSQGAATPANDHRLARRAALAAMLLSAAGESPFTPVRISSLCSRPGGCREQVRPRVRADKRPGVGRLRRAERKGSGRARRAAQPRAASGGGARGCARTDGACLQQRDHRAGRCAAVVRKLRERGENSASKCAGEPYPSARSSGKPLETNLKPTYHALRPGLASVLPQGGCLIAAATGEPLPRSDMETF